MPMLKRELTLFCTALSYYTRIPVPGNLPFSPDTLGRATRYLPLVGMIVGGGTAAVYLAASYLLPHTVALVASMISSILLTGAFHEDGFADTCDAFGGGYSLKEKLTIMKDSRIGTYGAVGLVMILLAKFTLLIETQPGLIPLVLIASHSGSRLIPVLLIGRLRYVASHQKSKAKGVATGVTSGEILFASLVTIASFIPLGIMALPVLICIPAIQWIAGRYFSREIGGYTGDCLGASQQTTEIILYTAFLILQTRNIL